MSLITCGECGNEYSNKASACPKCGCPTPPTAQPNTKTAAEPRPAPTAATDGIVNKVEIRQAQDLERVFLSEGGVRVTNTRFILPNQTFAMSGITSVQLSEEKPKRLWPVITSLFGALLLLLQGSGLWFVAVPLLGGGALWFARQKTYFYVRLNTASGEAMPFGSTDSQWISG